jgi:hypothetical protein
VRRYLFPPYQLLIESYAKGKRSKSSTSSSIRSAPRELRLVRGEREDPRSPNRIRNERHAVKTDTIPIGLASESVNHELIFQQISPLAESSTQSMTPSSYEKRVRTDAKFE